MNSDKQGFEVEQKYRGLAAVVGFFLVILSMLSAVAILVGVMPKQYPQTIWFPATLYGFGSASAALYFAGPQLAGKNLMRV